MPAATLRAPRLAQALDTPDARSRSCGREHLEHAPPHAAASPGSEVSRGGLPQDRLVQLRVSQKTLQTSVLLLQFLQPLRLVHPQTTVLLLPTVVRLLRHADLLARLRDLLPPAISTSASRSFPMICSAVNFFPRGIDCPPSVATTTRFSLRSWSRLKGAGQFNSDRDRHKFLYQFEIDRIIALFRQVGKDYPNCGDYNFNPKTGDYDHTQWIGDHDENGNPRVAMEYYSKI